MPATGWVQTDMRARVCVGGGHRLVSWEYGKRWDKRAWGVPYCPPTTLSITSLPSSAAAACLRDAVVEWTTSHGNTRRDACGVCRSGRWRMRRREWDATSRQFTLYGPVRPSRPARKGGKPMWCVLHLGLPSPRLRIGRTQALVWTLYRLEGGLFYREWEEGQNSDGKGERRENYTL